MIFHLMSETGSNCEAGIIKALMGQVHVTHSRIFNEGHENVVISCLQLAVPLVTNILETRLHLCCGF